jgi:hypothetical protein
MVAHGLFTSFDIEDIDDSSLSPRWGGGMDIDPPYRENPDGSRDLYLPLEGSELVPAFPVPDSVLFNRSSPTSLPGWPSGLVYELALGLDSENHILNKYMVSPEEYEYLKTLPAFRKDLVTKIGEKEKDGITFRVKARLQAEMYLENEIHEIVTNTSLPASTRLDAIKWVAKMGDLEPKEAKGENQQNQTFAIQINF